MKRLFISLASCLAALAPTIAAAQSSPFAVISATGTVSQDNDPNTRPASVAFRVKNISAQTQTLNTSGSCGIFRWFDESGMDWDCMGEATPWSATLAPGATIDVSVPLRVPRDWDQADNVSVTVWPSGNTALSTSGSAYVSWNSITPALTVQFTEATFTPLFSPRSQASRIAAYSTNSTSAAVINSGNASATYSLSVSCADTVVACSVSPTSITVAANATASFIVTYAARGAGSANVIIRAQAPPRASGLVERDSLILAVTAADIYEPRIEMNPAGDVVDAETGARAAVALSTRATIVVDLCDEDGTIGTPAMTLGGVAVPLATISATSVGGCVSSARATFNPPFVAGHNAIAVSVSDGIHTTTVNQGYDYDDAYDHRARITPVHPTAVVSVGQVVTDTFVVSNPGWHGAEYDVASQTYCKYSVSYPACPTPIPSPSIVAVPAGGSVRVPVTYTASSTVGVTTTVELAATLEAYTLSRAYAHMVATTEAILPPTISISPSSGTTVTTPTINLIVTWCDADDGIVQRTATWQGRALGDPWLSGTTYGCREGHFDGLTIEPWQQTVTASATDEQGHTFTRSANITYAAPLSDYRPAVGTKGGTKRLQPAVSALDTFVVANAGSRSAAYALTAACGAQPSCSVTPGSISLSPGASQAVVVGFQSGSTRDVPDSVRLIARFTSPLGGEIADTAKHAVVVPSVEAVPVVTAYSTAATGLQPHWIALTSYRLSNTGSTKVTYDLRWSTTGGFGFLPWLMPDTMVTLDPGQGRDIIVDVVAPALEGLAGSVTLTASYVSSRGEMLAASATTYWLVRSPHAAIIVGPKNLTQAVYPENILQQSGFFVQNIGNTYVSVSDSVICSDAVTNCRWSPHGLGVDVGETKGQIVDFDLVPGKALGTIRVIARDNQQPDAADETTIKISVGGRYIALSTAPKAQSRTLRPGRTFVQRFYVENVGTVAGSVSFTAICDAGVVCTSPQPVTVYVDAGKRDSTSVSITSATTSGTTGSVRLIAAATVPNVAADTSVMTVRSDNVADISVTVASASPGSSISRGECLTIAAGESGAYECGDLRIVHSLPATTTLNTARAPALTYLSRHASTVTLFAADVAVAPGNSVHSITAHVIVDGHASIDRTFTWDDQWSTGAPRRIVVPVTASGLQLPTGAYHYTFAVDARSDSLIQQQADGIIAVVNRSQSPFGAGWWLDGLEQIVPMDSTHRLWVGGDGSTRLYTRQTGRVWTVSPTLDRPDTLVVDSTGMYRHLRNGAYVQFDNLGRHIATVNARGHRTKFNYEGTSTDQLTSIDLPLPAQSTATTAMRRYVFLYDMEFNGRQYLTQVRAPAGPQGPRQITVQHLVGTTLISALVGPDTTRVGFEYADGVDLSGRTNRRGYQTSYSYDWSARTLAESVVRMIGTGDDIRSKFCAAEAMSVSSCAGAPVDTGMVSTQYDGPRTDVQDTMRVFTNRFGAPNRTVDALGHVTSIERTNTTWPLLATAVIGPDGFTRRATYNERALIERQTEEQPLYPLSTDSAVTRFMWNAASRFDLLDSIVSPTHEVTRFGYDTSGDRVWQRDMRGAESEVRFFYNGDRQMAATQAPGNSATQRDVLEYDSLLGNLRRTIDPNGVATTYHTDALGRVDTVFSPASNGIQRKQAMAFDLMDRVVDQRDIGPAVNYTIGDISAITPAVMLLVNTRYDAEGNVENVIRSSVPSLNGQEDLVLGWTYDGANRRLTATDAHGQTDSIRYDAAGNVMRTVSRRNLAITSTYDALNRIVTRQIPAATYAPQVMGTEPDVASKVRFPHFAPGFAYDVQASPSTMPPPLVIPGDTEYFAYDVAGNLIRADNAAAQVRRSYFRNGALRTDTLRIGVVDRDETPIADPFSLHTYVLSYGYDLSGRRTLRTDDVPNCAGCAQVYSYYDFGPLAQTFDRGATFGFTYDSTGRMKTRSASAPSAATLSDELTYDAGGRLTRRLIAGGLFDDVLTYDDAGRVLTTTTASSLPGASDATQQVYNGLGALAAIRREAGGVAPLDQYTTDAFGNAVQHKQRLGSGGIVTSQVYRGDRLTATADTALNWTPFSGQPLMQRLSWSNTAYDVGGNSTGSHTRLATYSADTGIFVLRTAGQEWTWNAYSADERLRASQRTYMVTDAVPRTAFIEHRYDALGRRVLTRTRWDQYCEPQPLTNQCLSSIDRTVWDGDQVLMEYRNVASQPVYEDHPDCLPDSVQSSEDCRDHFSPRWSQAGLGMVLETESTGGSFSGTVRYTHAGGIDEPLAIWKSGFESGIVPHRSWRGLYEAGSFLGPTSTDVSWPGRGRDAFQAPDARLAASTPPATHWLGSIVEGKSDASGLMYMRNRYYDPKNGRFTQEDPIGLGGGMNLYGFGGGDPVNFSDPFGLDCKSRSGESLPEKSCHPADAPLHEVTLDKTIADAILWLSDIKAATKVLSGVRQLSLAYARRKAVSQAWKMEAAMIRRTGQGTRAWTEAEISELLETGKVRGYNGHHINSVNGYPELAGNPNNVRFVRQGSEHLAEHDGNYRNPTTGSLVSRTP